MSGVSPEDREKAGVGMPNAAEGRLADSFQTELEWFDAQDYTGLSTSEVRSILARHLAMHASDAGWSLGGVSARPTREALAEAIYKANHGGGVLFDFRDLAESNAGRATRTECFRLADALLAVEHLWTQPAGEDGMLPFECHHCGERVREGGACGCSSVPVVDSREALARLVHEARTADEAKELDLDDYMVADAWLALGVVQDRAIVEREAAAKALEAVADEIGPWTLASETSNVLRTAAAEYREGRR